MVMKISSLSNSKNLQLSHSKIRGFDLDTTCVPQPQLLTYLLSLVDSLPKGKIFFGGANLALAAF